MNAINVRKFIQENYTPYDGDAGFLAGPTERTTKLWNEVLELMKQERSAGGVLDFDTKIISDITSHAAGYIDKELEQIVGLQTDKPLKRAIMPFGGIRVVRTSVEEHGGKLDPEVERIFKYRKTHNDGVFDVYTDEIKIARQQRAHHRPARRLRPRPHHRRLPPRGPLRRGLSDRAEERGRAALRPRRYERRR